MKKMKIAAQLEQPPAAIAPAIRAAGRQTVCLGLSFLFSRTVVAGGFSPFGIAFCAAVQPRYMLCALIGGGIGTFFTNTVDAPYRYLGGIIGASILSWAINSFTTKKARRILPALNALFCALFTGVVLTVSNGFSAADCLLYAAESALCGGCAFFFQRTVSVMQKKRALKTLSLSELVPVLCSAAVLLLCLDLFQIMGISPVRLLAVLLILIAGRYGAVPGGALAGLLLGFSMGLSADALFLTGVYGLGGCLAGAFASYGQVGSCAAFLLSSVMMLIFSTEWMEQLPVFLELAAGGLLFLLLPQKLCNRIDRCFNAGLDVNPTGSLRNSLVVKLRFAGSTMSGVSQSMHAVNEKLRELAVPPYGSLSKHLAQEVCSECRLKQLCWKKEGAQTIEGFRSLWERVQTDGQLTSGNLPAALESRCIHTDQLIHSYNRQYQALCEKERFENTVGHLRSVVADQLEGMSDMLFSLSDEFEAAETYDVETGEAVKRILENFGLTPRDVACVLDRFQRMRLEIHCPQPVHGLNDRRLHRAIGAACGRNFEDVHITFAGHEALLTYTERARLTLFTGTAQYASGGAAVCGDSVETLLDGKGHQIFLISDGMGTGAGAAIEGALASGMLAKLLKAGFGFDCALRIVNSALLVKSGEESLATLDVASIDLFNGRVDFYKAGASSSFLLKDGKAWKVELPSLPAGILREVEFAKTSVFVAPGDRLVLFSDGVADSDTGWLKTLLEQEQALSAQALAEKVLAVSRQRRAGQREDDMTVLTVEVQLNQD